MRVANWDVELCLWARDQRGRPYAWGATDCGSLLQGALCVIYGDGAPKLGVWDSLEAARATLKALGGIRGAARILGARKVGGAFMRSGDVLTVRGGHVARIHVAAGGKLLTSTVEDGVALVPPAAILGTATLWRLP